MRQPVFHCLNSTIKLSDQRMRLLRVNNKDIRRKSVALIRSLVNDNVFLKSWPRIFLVLRNIFLRAISVF